MTNELLNTIASFLTAFATLSIFFVAWVQLREFNKTTKGDFIHRFTKDFFTEQTRQLITLIDKDCLSFSKDQCFKIDKTQLNDLPINELEKEELRKKDLFSVYEVDDLLLGPIEDIAQYERTGLIDIQRVYDTFSLYVNMIWENKAISEYIKSLNADGDDIYEGFQKLYDKLKSYEAAKKNKKCF